MTVPRVNWTFGIVFVEASLILKYLWLTYNNSMKQDYNI